MSERARPPATIQELVELRDRTRIFRDRAHAGEVLAGMLQGALPAGTPVLGIPAGGIPVAAEVARRLRLPLGAAVVSKITLPWNTEAGYGAVAFDGTVRLNGPLVEALGLDKDTVAEGIALTRAKVARRAALFRGAARPPSPGTAAVLLVDDGLASGFTMETAVAALRGLGVGEVAVAVPTAHLEAARRLAAQVERVCCANLRGGRGFAVADAYRRWSDVPEEEALELLRASAARS